MATLNTLQMISIIQVYIHHRKDKEVSIIPPRNQREFLLLVSAYNIANEWLINNGFEQVF